MTGWTDAQVREALELDAARHDVAFTGVSTDTRTIQPGSLFVALRGPNFDAHDYLAQAAAKGAAGAVVERVPDDAPAGLVLYVVVDTLHALGSLARARRRRLGARVCAITGTNGKTSTKEMAKAVLSTRYRVHATTANLNNLVGTPLTLLTAPEGVEAIVVEVGTNAPGEIARLRDIVEPDAAIVTSVGEGHLEGLGSLEGVLAEKTSLLEGLDGVALVADEPPELPVRARGLAGRVRVAGWSERADADLRAQGVQLDDDGRPRFRWRGLDVRVALRGRPQARNALLALGLAEDWGVEPREGAGALGRLPGTKLRGEILRIGELTVIADCYNSNPGSLSAAVDLLAALPARAARVAVVGTMRELGPDSARLHRRAADEIAARGIDVVVATGEFVAAFEHLRDQLGAGLIAAEDPIEAYAALGRRLRGGEVVLLKGSRGVALERLLPLLERDWGPADAPDTLASRTGE